MAHILAKIGWPVVQLDGGYKTFRAYVNASLEEAPQLEFKVICGTTGSGKSRLLEVLDSIGAQVLDLEKLAAHRGSVLGNLPNEPQPSQKLFETMVWDKLRRFDPSKPVFVESESKKVGQCRVPAALMDKMRASPCISLNLSRPNRVRLLMEDYTHFTSSPAALNEQLGYLVSLHGHEKINAWQTMANEGRMTELVDELLVTHYDPAYLKSIHRNFQQFGQAEQLDLGDISPAHFLTAATKLAGK
jgi:tRNA 2-selenouridine synthase